MKRSLTLSNLYDKKFSTMAFDGIWAMAMGEPERNGIWLIYGKEKHGKTWFALKLAEYLSQFDRVLYVSAEEGIGKNIRDTAMRARIDRANKRIHLIGYEPFSELEERMGRRKSERIIIIDNLTIYRRELTTEKLTEIMRKNVNKLIVLLAHEEKEKPYGTTAILASKYAKIIMHIKGLNCFVTGRCPGGVLRIDEQRSALLWGNEMKG